MCFFLPTFSWPFVSKKHTSAGGWKILIPVRFAAAEFPAIPNIPSVTSDAKLVKHLWWIGENLTLARCRTLRFLNCCKPSIQLENGCWLKSQVSWIDSGGPRPPKKLFGISRHVYRTNLWWDWLCRALQRSNRCKMELKVRKVVATSFVGLDAKLKNEERRAKQTGKKSRLLGRFSTVGFHDDSEHIQETWI